MDTLIQEVELMAKEKDAEENGTVSVHSNEGWEPMTSQSDQPATLGREIPVLPNR
jgi:(E)-4-hydroxy-3-methylbut-2-enyl-diphosphate synthase